MHDAIVVQNLGKRFRRYRSDRPSTIHEVLMRGIWSLAASDFFWGLKDVSFRIAPGRMVGVVGRNGAGKSTLLRLIGGVGRADEGSVEVRGNVRALLTLGAGFHPELSGRENLYVNGIIGGLTRREVQAKFDSIVDFSELEQYIESPLRTYSTGMQMRLAFSIAIHSAPDVLLIDEVLAVGDLAFQRKCLDRIQQLKSAGCTVVVVSHDAGMTQELCEETLWLNAGHLEAYGPSREVVLRYCTQAETVMAGNLPVANPEDAPPIPHSAPEDVLPEQEVDIKRVRLLGQGDLALDEVQTGGPLTVEISFTAERPLAIVNFGVVILRNDGLVCCDFVSKSELAYLSDFCGDGQVILRIDRLDLGAGSYHVNIFAFADDPADRFSYETHAGSFVVRGPDAGNGVVASPHRWQVNLPAYETAAGSSDGAWPENMRAQRDPRQAR